MLLSNEQREILSTKLDKYLSLGCRICGEKNIVFDQHIYELREFNKGAMIVGEGIAVYPVVLATCPNCGNAVIFSAIALGLVELQESHDRDPQEE